MSLSECFYLSTYILHIHMYVLRWGTGFLGGVLGWEYRCEGSLWKGEKEKEGGCE